MNKRMRRRVEVCSTWENVRGIRKKKGSTSQCRYNLSSRLGNHPVGQINANIGVSKSRHNLIRRPRVSESIYDRYDIIYNIELLYHIIILQKLYTILIQIVLTYKDHNYIRVFSLPRVKCN